MGKRYAKSGYNDTAIDTNARSILEPDRLKSGRVFRLKGLVISNEHATGTAVVEIFNEEEATTPAAPTAANQRLNIQVGPADTVVIDFPAPGVLFTAGPTAIQSGGTVAAYSVAAMGYEE